MKERLKETQGERYDVLAEESFYVGMTNLAAVLLRKNEHEEAFTLSRDALNGLRRLPGEKKHSSIGDTLSTLGRAEFQLGRFEDASAHFQEAVELRRKLYPENDRRVALALVNLAKAELELARYSTALDASREAVQMIELEPEGSSRSRFLGVAQTAGAEALAALGRFEECTAEARSALDTLEPVSESLLEWRLPMTRHVHSFCALRLQDSPSVESVLLEALRAMETHGASTWDLRRALARTADLYDALGRPEVARQYRSRLSA